jgi:hypothetical protein
MPAIRSQAERDQQTITIATGLAIFAGIVLAVFVLALLVNASSDLELSGGAASALGFGTVLLAAVASIAYLVRHRR